MKHESKERLKRVSILTMSVLRKVGAIIALVVIMVASLFLVIDLVDLLFSEVEDHNIVPLEEQYLNIQSNLPKKMNYEEKAAIIQAVGAERSANIQANALDRNSLIMSVATIIAASLGVFFALRQRKNVDHEGVLRNFGIRLREDTKKTENEEI